MDYQVLVDALQYVFGQMISEVTPTMECIRETAYTMQRPSMVLKPKLSMYENQWRALYGENLQEGLVGFGDSPHMAMLDFDVQYYTRAK